MRAAFYEGHQTISLGQCVPAPPARGQAQIRVSHRDDDQAAAHARADGDGGRRAGVGTGRFRGGHPPGGLGRHAAGRADHAGLRSERTRRGPGRRDGRRRGKSGTMSVLDLFRLDGKTALVTGARRGIGKAMAIALAEAGADIIGVSRSMEPSGSEIEKEVLARGRKFTGYACDFKDRKAVYAFLEKALAENPVIDILVNNAGTILRKPAVEHPDEYWDEVIDTNLNSQWVISREIGKRMVAARLRQGDLHGVAADLPGRHHGARLRGQQGSHRATGQGAGERMGAPRRAGERRRAGLYRHR